MDFEKLYDIMIGQVEPEPGYPVEDCYKGECERLYGKISDARMRISAALDRDLRNQNREVLSIMNDYEDMQRIFCRWAFTYGVRYGRGEIQL